MSTNPTPVRVETIQFIDCLTGKNRTVYRAYDGHFWRFGTSEADAIAKANTAASQR